MHGDDLFPSSPRFPPALPDDELRLLQRLPDWDAVTEIEQCEEAVARRLERRGLVKIERHKTDPIAIRPTLFAGRLPLMRLAR